MHFFPYVARFPAGGLLASYCLDPDTNDNPVFVGGTQISPDGGAHWGRRATGLELHPMVFVPKPNNSLMGIPYEIMQQSVGDEHNFVAPSFLFTQGGRATLETHDDIRIVDWPWPVDVTPSSQPRENWVAELVLASDVLESEGRLLLVGYGKKKGEHFYRSFLLASEDGGHIWRYFSTIGLADPALTASPDRYEGPNETTVTRLTDGDLMAVYRVGSGIAWHLRRTYSHDGGRTWSPVDTLPAYSVRPALLRSANGVVALSTGRPGIDLWLAGDARARQWQRIDIVAHHNAWAPDASYRIGSTGSGDTLRWQTDAYTNMVEVAPNRLLLIYDRDGIVRPPERAPTGPEDISRIFVLPIELERR